MDAETRTLGEMRDSLVERATADAEFRSRLVADPKAAVKEELGFDLPSGFTFVVHEEKLGTAHLVLPPADTLDEGELNRVVGGGEGDWTYRSEPDIDLGWGG